MDQLKASDIEVLKVQARLGRTLEQALAILPKQVSRSVVRQRLHSEGVTFRRRRPRLRSRDWVAAACREYYQDGLDARMSNRERGRIRYRVLHMGMTIEQALNTEVMTPAEKGRIGAERRWRSRAS